MLLSFDEFGSETWIDSVRDCDEFSPCINSALHSVLNCTDHSCELYCIVASKDSGNSYRSFTLRNESVSSNFDHDANFDVMSFDKTVHRVVYRGKKLI